VNNKKVRRLIRQHDLQPKRRRRYVATIDSNHDSPIFPNCSRDLVVDNDGERVVLKAASGARPLNGPGGFVSEDRIL